MLIGGRKGVGIRTRARVGGVLELRLEEGGVDRGALRSEMSINIGRETRDGLLLLLLLLLLDLLL